VPGFDLVADELHLPDHLERADLVITGEGHLDRQSFEGKVVGGVAAMATASGVPVAVICGIADDDAAEHAAALGIEIVSLVERFGEELAWREPRLCVEQAALELLRSRAG
jgi:glycerate kinase